jgi:hypothetical protein
MAIKLLPLVVIIFSKIFSSLGNINKFLFLSLIEKIALLGNPSKLDCSRLSQELLPLVVVLALLGNPSKLDCSRLSQELRCKVTTLGKCAVHLLGGGVFVLVVYSWYLDIYEDKKRRNFLRLYFF